MKKYLCYISVITMMLTSCNKDALVGGGEIITEIRSTEIFDKIQISGNRETEIIKSNERKVEVTGYANLVHQYDEQVSNGILSFQYPAFSRVRRDNIRLKIYTPDITHIGLNGNSTLEIKDGFVADRLTFQLSGNTRVISEGGAINELRIDASGNPEIYLRPMQAKKVELQLSGNPWIEVFAGETLLVNASGAGKIKYWGSPLTTTLHLSGTVKVERQ